MNSSHAALGALCLTVAGLWYASGGASVPTQSASAAEVIHVSAPVAHENLTVYFIHGADTVANAQIMTLQEALESGKAIVHETGNVNSLTVENLSEDTELFIQQGDIISGGRQDRMIANDMLLPPKSGRVSFPCNCVEHGRWTQRGKEAPTHFNKCDQFVVGNKLMNYNILQNQTAVWNSVAEKQKQLGEAAKADVNSIVSATSLQLTLDNPIVQSKIAEYLDALKTRGEVEPNVIGVVFLVNGEMTCAEIYGSNALFQKAWPKLLRSAATEALAEKKSRIPDAPSARSVERFLAHAGQSQTPPMETINAGRQSSNVLSIVVETRVGNVQLMDIITLERFQTNETHAQPNPSGVPAASVATDAPQRAGRIILDGNTVTNDRVILNQNDLRPGQAATTQTVTGYGNPNSINLSDLAPSAQQPVVNQPASPSANQLNVRHVENAAGLVTESRDPTRQNAVIHRSFIKK